MLKRLSIDYISFIASPTTILNRKTEIPIRDLKFHISSVHDRLNHPHDLRDPFDIMDTDNRRAVSDRPRNGGGGAHQTVAAFGFARDLPDKSLSAGADDQRASENRQLPKVPKQLEVVTPGLPEADPGVDQDTVEIHP